jgi:hypothetical protein
MRKFTLRVFFVKFHLFASQRVFSVKMRKNERNESDLFLERGLATKISVNQLLFAPPMWGNLSLEVVFVAGGRKIYEKKPLGRGYNLAIAKKAREKKKDTRALEHPWANY